VATVTDTNGRSLSYNASQYNLAGVIRNVLENKRHLEDIQGPEAGISRALQSHQPGFRHRGLSIPVEALFGRQRSLDSSTGASLVTTPMAPTVEWTDVLRRKAVTAALGVRYFSAYSQDTPLAFPSKDTNVSVEWLTDDDAPTPSFPDFTADAEAGKPKIVAAAMTIPRRLWNLGDGQANDYLFKDMQDSIAAELDRAVVNGAGTLEPVGLLNTSGVPTQAIGANGGPPTRAALLAAMRAVAVANGDSSVTACMGWLTSPQGESKLRSTDGSTGTAGAWLWNDFDRIVGRSAYSTTAVPADKTKGSGSALTPLVYGNWDDILVNVNPAATIIVNPFVNGDGTLVRVTAFLDVKVLVRHTASFVIIPDMATS
jgi:HK97 family phage major capsid protein